jgi:hypothetical protein
VHGLIIRKPCRMYYNPTRRPTTGTSSSWRRACST